MAIFKDILSPLRRLSLSMQHENHDPVKIICCINEFTWAMSKLQLIMENSLDGNENQVKTCQQNSISNVKKNNNEYFYQDIKLHKYEITIARARDMYSSTITNICSKVEARFSSLLDSVIFKNIPQLLDKSAWPKNDSANFGDKEINELSDHFNVLFEKMAVMFKVLTKSGSFKAFNFTYFAKHSERILFGDMAPLTCQHRANV